jgi:phosphomecalonate degydratase small subunit
VRRREPQQSDGPHVGDPAHPAADDSHALTLSRSHAPDLILRGPPGVGPVVEGEALVSTYGFSARYDLNRKTGVFSRESHDLYGQSVIGKILVHTTAKGGVATAWALYEMRASGTAPLGLLFSTTNPIMVQGAVLAGLSLMHRLEPDAPSSIRSGDWLWVSPVAGTVEVWRKP